MSTDDNNLPPNGSYSRTAGIFMLKGLSHLPFWFLYGLSDLMALVLQFVMKYRKEVIITNLRRAFPEYNDREIARVVRKFYRHFADITLESVKAYSMSWKSFDQRVTFRGIDQMNAYYEQGKSVIVLAMHFNNWEWSGSAQPLMKHQYLVIYNPMRNNPEFEEYLRQIRERWGAKMIPVHKSSRSAMEFDRMKIPVALVLAADQRPPVITRFWTTFLNQEACFYQGPEKIARKSNQPVFFHLTRKIKRGHYEVSFIPLVENPTEVTEQEIMLTYVQTMEKYIREEPAYYLWSHKRWKQQRPDGYTLY